MKTWGVAVLLAVSSVASADVKIGDHELAFTKPPKFRVDESIEKGVWVGQYNLDKPDQQIVVTALARKDADGPVDFAKQQPKLDKQMDLAGLKPDNAATRVEADGFVATSRHYISKDPKQPAWGMVALVDAGPVALVVFSNGFAAPNELTKSTLAVLASLTIDGKKGPFVYPKK